MIVYTGNGCAVCRQVKRHLDHKEVVYEEVNVDEHPTIDRAWLYTQFSSMSVPVTTNGEDVMIGYQAPKLTKMIKRRQHGRD